MKVLMTGGGTAGHVNPALAIAATLREKHPEAEIAFAASALARDKAGDLVPRAGYPLHTVHIRGMIRPVWSPTNLRLPYYMIKSKAEAGRLIDTFKPDLIVGTGGFACWPVCRMGIKKRVPTALHESNALPGKAIERLAGRADLVMTNFEETVARLGGKEHMLRVGNPMMPGFSTVSREEARRALGLSSEEIYVLSFGGSLGAEYVNEAVVRLAATIAGAGNGICSTDHVVLHHAAGKREYDRIRALWDATPAGACPRTLLLDYIYDMPTRMAAADLVISRAGAMSLSELALTGKAAILIPSPYVAEQHQLKNALALVHQEAALCVEEHTLKDGALTEAALALIGDVAGRARMGKNIRTHFACPDANERIYEALMHIIMPK